MKKSLRISAVLLSSLLLSGLVYAGSAKDAWGNLVGKRFATRAAFQFVQNDPALKNVLIYGDSISIGYTHDVQKALDGKANVYRIYCNGGDSGSFVTKMTEMHKVMRDEKNEGHWSFDWDVVHFNVGLHDLKYTVDGKLDKETGTQVISAQVYQKNLRDIISYLNKLTPKAKLVFTTTTPVPEGERGRVAGDAVKYNKLALEVLKDHPEIVINDLHGFVMPALSEKWLQSGNVHYSSEQSKALGDEVTRVILKELALEDTAGEDALANKKAKRAAKKDTKKDRKKKAASLVPDKFITYKTADSKDGEVELKLHVFNPKGIKPGDKRAAIVFFFGGGWNSGSPSQFYPQSEYLASRGMVAISAEYRVRSRNGTSPLECVKDGKSAVRWIRQHADELGIDPKRLAAGGGSAGGHVAAASGITKGLNEDGEDLSVSSVPNALVLFNPVFDNGPDGYGYDRVKEYWEIVSPIHNINKKTPPTIVFLGTKDKLIPVSVAERYKKLMEKASRRCDLYLYEGQPHGFFNKAKYNETLQETEKFLTSLGFLKN